MKTISTLLSEINNNLPKNYLLSISMEEEIFLVILTDYVYGGWSKIIGKVSGEKLETYLEGILAISFHYKHDILNW